MRLVGRAGGASPDPGPELGAIDDDDEVRQTQMTPGVRGDENWVCDGVKGFLEWPYSCHLEGVNRCSSGGRGDGCGDGGARRGNGGFRAR